MQGIYVIINKKNNKVYVGQAIDIHSRWNEHIKALKSNRHKNRYIQRAFNMYGIEYFDFKVLETVDDKSQLTDREQHWMDVLKALDNKYGYNLKYAGDGGKHIEETKLRISRSNKGKKKSQESIEKMSKSKIGSVPWNKGIKMPAAFSKRMSEIHRGKKAWNEGRAWSDDVKKKISESKKGKVAFRKIPLEEHEVIIERMLNGEKANKIAEEYHVSNATIRNIFKKR